jgi:hypothetical protein
MTRFRLATTLIVAGPFAVWVGCSEPAECGGDICLVYATVAGQLTAPNGEPVPGLRLESQSAEFQSGSGCDTTRMMTWYDVETSSSGEYILTVPNGTVDEVHCAFVRLRQEPGLAWNDTLVGPLELGEFGTEPPRDTTRADIVLQPAP